MPGMDWSPYKPARGFRRFYGKVLRNRRLNMLAVFVVIDTAITMIAWVASIAVGSQNAEQTIKGWFIDHWFGALVFPGLCVSIWIFLCGIHREHRLALDHRQSSLARIVKNRKDDFLRRLHAQSLELLGERAKLNEEYNNDTAAKQSEIAELREEVSRLRQQLDDRERIREIKDGIADLMRTGAHLRLNAPPIDSELFGPWTRQCVEWASSCGDFVRARIGNAEAESLATYVGGIRFVVGEPDERSNLLSDINRKLEWLQSLVGRFEVIPPNSEEAQLRLPQTSPPSTRADE